MSGGFRAGKWAHVRSEEALPLIACASILFSVVAVVVGQFGPDPYLDPLNVTVSEYAVSNHGGEASTLQRVFESDGVTARFAAQGPASDPAAGP
ncbi:hypothetical protein AB0L65_57260 [Nonomuraea sp. NPDC052116]|uniref:hypothetical protein n=1 Tax=Nonomuraea sp. NPDC052116 TaxID=3155665 RepID=UPI003431685C